MEIFSTLFNEIINPIFAQPSFILGTVTFAGLAALRKPFVELLQGTVKTIIGVLLLQNGSGLMVAMFRPIIFSFTERFQIEGVIIDPYVTLSAVTDALGEKLGWVGFTMLIGFGINLLLVAFRKYTHLHSLFLTGHVMFLQSALITWIVYYYFGYDLGGTVLLAGSLIGLYWSVGAQMNAKPAQIINKGAGFTVAHQQHLMNWVAWKVAPKIGDPKQSIEKIKFPAWLDEFRKVEVSVPLVMFIIFTPLLLLLGSSELRELSGMPGYLYVPIVAISFGAYVLIMNQGITMFVGELSTAFKGISQKLLPDALIGVDGMALAPYAPNAVMAGFICCALGQFGGVLMLVLMNSPVLIIPSFIPVFFDAAITAVFADTFGGWRALVVISFGVGLIHIFGNLWAAKNSGLVGGWMGNSDWATIWPLVMQGMKAISPLR
ncbi:MAG: PTS transporter subunit IIC [Chloroflexi bacterium]|nr:PTS transporter subunit IIC [Chloroflexota bacterium]